ncbi:MAG TPA: hypothetical protein EYP51_07625, partial [Thiotrichales bacterium]|nr:hypothetical protein [Thiotrichales bacterium]
AKRAHDYGMFVAIATNGTLLNKENVKKHKNCGVCRYCRSKYLPCLGETHIAIHGNVFRCADRQQESRKGWEKSTILSGIWIYPSPFSRPVAVSGNRGQSPRMGD